MRRLYSYHCWLGVALLLVVASGVAAQEFRATIKGQVVDSSKAGVPGATVSVQNTDTNEIATTTSNAEGNYTLPFLRPGSYTLTVELSGFQKHTRSGMRLEVGQTAEINVQLAVGGVTEEVNVAAESPILETSKADRGTVIDSARIAELPLQSRSPMALAVLVAGVNYNAQAVYLRPFDNGALAAWSMNGGSSSNNEFLLDGVPNNANQGGNNIAYVPPAEAVQEMKISTNSYDAQYGRTADADAVLIEIVVGLVPVLRVQQERVRIERLAAEELVADAVERVRSRLQGHVDHAAGGAAVLGVVGVGRDLELAHRFGRRS